MPLSKYYVKNVIIKRVINKKSNSIIQNENPSNSQTVCPQK